jgi:hypothetical protein
MVFILLKAASAQTGAQAEGFVRKIYAGYHRSASSREPDYLGKDAPLVFSPSLLALIRKDRRKAKGEIGTLDFDPICACQDADGLALSGVTIRSDKYGRAVANVSLQYRQPAIKRLELELLWTPAGWRIDDISSMEVPSLRKLLQ